MKATLDQMKREPCPLSALMVATKCGGTDATSGLAANPAVGCAMDRLVAAGGSAILSECNELLGTEDYLARRAVSPEVARKVYDAIYGIEDVLRSGLDPTLPANRNFLIFPWQLRWGSEQHRGKGPRRCTQVWYLAYRGRHRICYPPLN